ncbi:hypothetical protein MYXO_02444 [Myxococcaceae bacterium]|jgi:LEA14-like dessication related protein|nr:hypothetical protein MYXO_02444 [Myxococcaceae bacterium]
MKARLRALGLVAALSVLASCASFGSLLERPEVSLVSLTPEPSSGLEQRFRVELRISNPNTRALEVTGLRFELELNDRRLARGQSGEGVRVPRLGDATLGVDATTTLLDVLRQVSGIPGTKEIRYRISGRVFLAGFFPPWIDFDHSDVLVTLPEAVPRGSP